MLEHRKALPYQSVKIGGISFLENWQSAGKSYAYILGAYLGDGCVTNAHKKLIFKLNTIDRDFAEAVKYHLSQISDKPVHVHQYTDNRWSKPSVYNHVTCSDHELCVFLREQTNNKMKIPEYVFEWDNEMLSFFIVGLMDSEGYVAENRTIKKDCTQLTNKRFFMGFKCCDPWIYDFVELLKKYGLQIGKVRTEKPRKEGYKTPVVFGIKMQSWVNSGLRFNIERKNKRVDEWNSSPAYANRSKNPKTA